MEINDNNKKNPSVKWSSISPNLNNIYPKKLLKFTIILSVVPTMVLAIMVLYDKVSLPEGMLGVIFVIIGSSLFARPYIDDLSNLTLYVEKLAHDKHEVMPSLSFLGGVAELSAAVKNLNSSWEEKKIRLEAAIAESSILFDTIPDILMMLGRDMCSIRANKAASALFGKNIENSFLPNIIKEKVLKDMITSVLGGSRGKNIELTITSHNVRRDFQINIEKFPLYSIGGIAVVLVMHDVTEAKKTRQMIKDFVANASHEIRTPLTSISGFIENLREAEVDQETQKRFLDIMYEQSERMITLVNDLLSLSKVEMNESTIPTDKVEVCELVQSSIRRLEHLAKDKNMKIVYEGANKLPEIIGDANELVQVFTNLISNAIKYGYNDTDIKITVNEEENNSDINSNLYKTSGKVIIVAVEDKGEGIPEEHLPRITERFYRVDKARSRNIGGTGLGLAIVKHIMNRHRGDILIKSKEGKGSVFTVIFPVQ